ncbi:AfaD family invasin [Rahnella sp. PAMC 25559]|uniref:AfaD family invasin n=1 Tax=Rahnella sp. PAMC 25559 TaxID=3423225 RepID=UPI003D66B54B
MKTEMKYFLMAALLPVFAAWSTDSRAEAPQLTVQVRTGQTAGAFTDGALLAQGTVIYTGEHSGFRVWSEGTINGAPQRLTLAGNRNPENRMNIRLTGRDWQADTERGQGIIHRTGDYSSAFNVEVDGNQNLPVDTWPLQLKAVVLIP